MSATLPILQTLWDVSEAEARRISRHLFDRSLALRGDVLESIRLHDLQLDYVRAQYLNKEALELIHEAIRYSSEVIAKDPSQFASQVVGRLECFRAQATVKQFLDRLCEATPSAWLRPLFPTLKAPAAEFICALVGHAEGVHSVALSGDGRIAVSASADRTLTVWDLASGRELRTLEGHTDGVMGVALSGDGRRAVSASEDKTLKVWEVESGRELRALEGHTDGMTGVALSGDGRLAVSASWDDTLKVWEVESGRELRTLAGHTAVVRGVALSGDGRLAVSASYDNTLKVWEVESGRELRTLKGHTAGVSGVALSGDGRRAVSASWDKTLKVWDLETGKVLATFTCDREARCCAFSDGGKLIVAGDEGGHVHFLRLEEPKAKS